jgi:hypothetical protein
VEDYYQNKDNLLPCCACLMIFLGTWKNAPDILGFSKKILKLGENWQKYSDSFMFWDPFMCVRILAKINIHTRSFNCNNLFLLRTRCWVILMTSCSESWYDVFSQGFRTWERGVGKIESRCRQISD